MYTRTYIYIVDIFGAICFQIVTESLDPTVPFGSVAPPQIDHTPGRL
jgi:hypothetical protein